MKNTIKLSKIESLVIETVGEQIRLSVVVFGSSVATKVLDADQLGATMFALERAAEVIEVARQNRRALEIAGQGGAT